MGGSSPSSELFWPSCSSLSRSVMGRSEGEENMIHIAEAVRKGAMAYLVQYRVVFVVFIVLVAILILGVLNISLFGRLLVCLLQVCSRDSAAVRHEDGYQRLPGRWAAMVAE